MEFLYVVYRCLEKYFWSCSSHEDNSVDITFFVNGVRMKKLWSFKKCVVNSGKSRCDYLDARDEIMVNESQPSGHDASSNYHDATGCPILDMCLMGETHVKRSRHVSAENDI